MSKRSSSRPTDDEVTAFVIEQAEQDREWREEQEARHRHEQERIERVREEHPYAYEDLLGL